jgi:hypothetical protein
MVKISYATVLSLDITAHGNVAFAVLEGPERLVEWGTVYVKDKKKHNLVERVESLFWRYLPDLLVLEAPAGKGSRRGPRAKTFIHRIEVLARAKSLPLRGVSRGDVNFAFRGTATNKQEIAEAIARLFPELEDELPKAREIWESEKGSMNVFDAISFALAVFRSPEALEEIRA